MLLTRRSLLCGVSLLILARPTLASVPALKGRRVDPVPLRYVQLRPSIFADAFAANRCYLLALDPERLLHNFYVSAGLPAPKPSYGGWESQGIAGHSLGHWLAACSLVVANTGDSATAAKLDHALTEMARIQTAHGDGYCGGTTVERDGRTIDGKVIFEEVRRGDIRSQGFDLNGGWVPLYTWHKIHAGLLDAHNLARHPRALPIALGLAQYLAGVLEPLSDDQMQQLLRTEHGGLNESYAETYAITGDRRWLHLAEKLRHKAVLDPLTAQQDHLAGLHANTQIPKVIGLARLYEITGDPRHATAARFFHDAVSRHHSYVIGGNSERERFGPPDQLSTRITDATCEACNSYNMLKLTRHLYSWQPHARWFDFYERVQLNHILAHQRPDTGRFVYFMPLASGARRTFSDPTESFWCCVGSGMESHSKHADSIYWSDQSALYVNLYIPSELDWPDRRIALRLETDMPAAGDVKIVVQRMPPRRQILALRLPSWATGPTVRVNGHPHSPTIRDGYALLERVWRPGDTISLTLPMALSVEPTPDDPAIVAFTLGPLVLAADLGPASAPFSGLGPALAADEPVQQLLRPRGGPHTFVARDALGQTLNFAPYFSQYDRRTAVYFPTFTSAGWSTARGNYLHAQEEAKALARRTVDTVYLGEMQPERDHKFTAGRSEVVNWNGRSARHVRAGDTMHLTLARRPGPAVLRVLMWGADVNRSIRIAVDGVPISTERPTQSPQDHFVSVDFKLPSAGAQSKPTAEISFTPVKDDAVIYEVSMLTDVDGRSRTTIS